MKKSRLPPVRLGKRGKPTPKDWQHFWSAAAREITTVADDRVRQRKEFRKVQGAFNAALKRSDLVAASEYRYILDMFFVDVGVPQTQYILWLTAPPVTTQARHHTDLTK